LSFFLCLFVSYFPHSLSRYHFRLCFFRSFIPLSLSHFILLAPVYLFPRQHHNPYKENKLRGP
jgi:hypothetical protein